MPIGQVQEPTVVEQVVQQVAGQVEEPKPAALPEDVDARALAEAKAELAAEQEAAKTAGEVKPELDPAAAQPEKKPEAQPELKAGEGDKPKHMPGFVPLDRFKSIVDERNQRDRQIAYLAGQLSIIQKPADAGKPEPTPQEQIEAIKAKRLELADQLDNGHISNRKAEEERQSLAGQEDAIRAKLNTPKPEPKPQAKSDDLYLDTKLSELETQHPYVKAMEDPQFKDAWDYLGKIATRELLAEGVLKPGLQPTAAQTLAFKTRLAELTDKHGQAITGKTLDLPTKAKAPEQPKPGSPSKTATARAEKLAMQADMPPDVSQLGSSPSASPDHSDAAIERMDEEDIAKLPKATRDRILGRVPA